MMHVRNTTTNQSVRIAVFCFTGAVALMAQAPANHLERAETELIAFNSPAVSYPSPTASIVTNSQPQFLTGGDKASPETVKPVQPATQIQTLALLKPQLAPGISTMAMAPNRGANSGPDSSGKAWFTAGPNAFPATARMDPVFGLSSSKNGAAPAAVSFSFGKK